MNSNIVYKLCLGRQTLYMLLRQLSLKDSMMLAYAVYEGFNDDGLCRL